MADAQLQILIDVRTKLDEIAKTQNAMRDLGKEVASTGQALKAGFGIDIARRSLSFLQSTVRELAVDAVNMADSIKDGAQNLSLSTQAYQVLGNLLRDAGGDVSMLTQAVSNNTRSLVDARTEGTAAASAYRTLGLNVSQLASLPIERRFELIARAVANAADQDKAYAASGQILVQRGLPTLLGALKDLAADGWDKVSEAQIRAGRVMESATIDKLEKAKKSWENFGQRMTITTGGMIGDAMQLSDAFQRAFKVLPFAAAGSLLHPSATGKLFGSVWSEFIKEPGTGSAPPLGDSGAAAAKDIALKNAVATAEQNLALRILQRQTVENNPNLTGLDAESQHLDQMKKELKLRELLIAAVNKSPPEDGETQQARDLKIAKLTEQNKQLSDQVDRLKGSNQFNDAAQASRDNYELFRLESVDDTQTPGGSFKQGAMDWVVGLGSQSQQVAAAMQSTIGDTVHSISEGIYGWVTGASSFGSALLNLGGTVLRTLIDQVTQMGVQWLLTGVLAKGTLTGIHAVGAVLRTKETTEVIAAETAKKPSLIGSAAAANAGSFGMSAIVGLAILAALMAAFGGFESGGYTGSGATDAVAGFVHGQEGVLNAPAMRRLGVDNLARMNAGLPVNVAAPAFGGAGSLGGSSSRESGRNIHVYLDRSAWLDAVQNDLSGIAHEVYDQRARA